MDEAEKWMAGWRAMMDSDAPNWEGLPGSSEHRTVGPHRAWNFATTQWCSPDSLCPDCDQVRLPERWQGLNVGDVLAELRVEVAASLNNLDEDSNGPYALGRRHTVWSILDLIDGKFGRPSTDELLGSVPDLDVDEFMDEVRFEGPLADLADPLPNPITKSMVEHMNDGDS